MTKYRDEVDVKKVPYTVMVLDTVDKQIQVPVCRVVPKVVTQTCRVWVPDCGNGVGGADAAGPAPQGARMAAPHAAPTRAPANLPAPCAGSGSAESPAARSPGAVGRMLVA